MEEQLNKAVIKEIDNLKKEIDNLNKSLKLANKKIFSLQNGFSPKQVNEIKKIINALMP